MLPYLLSRSYFENWIDVLFVLLYRLIGVTERQVGEMKSVNIETPNSTMQSAFT